MRRSRATDQNAISYLRLCSTVSTILLIVSSLCCVQSAGSDRLASAYIHQPRHTVRIYSITFSPDGRLLASASWDGTVKLWDITTGREIRTLAGHGRGIYRVVFSPDGKLLATASRDWTVKVWDVATGREVRALTGHTHAVKSVTWSPDGRMLATASNDGTVKLWDSATRRQVRTLTHTEAPNVDRSVYSVAWSPDGLLLASGNGDYTVSMWEVATGHELRTLAGAAGSLILSVAFSPDGRLIAPADTSPQIRIWEVATGKLIHTLEEPPVEGIRESVMSVAWSPDGRTLASGEARIDQVKRQYHGRIKLWDVATGHEVRAVDAHVQGTGAIAFSPDGRLLASGSEDATIKLWRFPELAALQTLSASPLEARGEKAISFDTISSVERMLQDTTAGQRLGEWLDSFSTGNVYVMRGFIKERHAASALKGMSADDLALADLRLYQESGPFHLQSIKHSTKSEITVLAKASRGEEWRSIRVQVEEADPQGITAIEIRHVPAPPKVTK